MKPHEITHVKASKSYQKDLVSANHHAQSVRKWMEYLPGFKETIPSVSDDWPPPLIASEAVRLQSRWKSGYRPNEFEDSEPAVLTQHLLGGTQTPEEVANAFEKRHFNLDHSLRTNAPNGQKYVHNVQHTLKNVVLFHIRSIPKKLIGLAKVSANSALVIGMVAVPIGLAHYFGKMDLLQTYYIPVMGVVKRLRKVKKTSLNQMAKDVTGILVLEAIPWAVGFGIGGLLGPIGGGVLANFLVQLTTSVGQQMTATLIDTAFQKISFCVPGAHDPNRAILQQNAMQEEATEAFVKTFMTSGKPLYMYEEEKKRYDRSAWARFVRYLPSREPFTLAKHPVTHMAAGIATFLFYARLPAFLSSYLLSIAWRGAKTVISDLASYGIERLQARLVASLIADQTINAWKRKLGNVLDFPWIRQKLKRHVLLLSLYNSCIQVAWTLIKQNGLFLLATGADKVLQSNQLSTFVTAPNRIAQHLFRRVKSGKIQTTGELFDLTYWNHALPFIYHGIDGTKARYTSVSNRNHEFSIQKIAFDATGLPSLKIQTPTAEGITEQTIKFSNMHNYWQIQSPEGATLKEFSSVTQALDYLAANQTNIQLTFRAQQLSLFDPPTIQSPTIEDVSVVSEYLRARSIDANIYTKESWNDAYSPQNDSDLVHNNARSALYHLRQDIEKGIKSGEPLSLGHVQERMAVFTSYVQRDWLRKLQTSENYPALNAMNQLYANGDLRWFAVMTQFTALKHEQKKQLFTVLQDTAAIDALWLSPLKEQAKKTLFQTLTGSQPFTEGIVEVQQLLRSFSMPPSTSIWSRWMTSFWSSESVKVKSPVQIQWETLEAFHGLTDQEKYQTFKASLNSTDKGKLYSLLKDCQGAQESLSNNHAHVTLASLQQYHYLTQLGGFTSAPPNMSTWLSLTEYDIRQRENYLMQLDELKQLYPHIALQPLIQNVLISGQEPVLSTKDLGIETKQDSWTDKRLSELMPFNTLMSSKRKVDIQSSTWFIASRRLPVESWAQIASLESIPVPKVMFLLNSGLLDYPHVDKQRLVNSVWNASSTESLRCLLSTANSGWPLEMEFPPTLFEDSKEETASPQSTIRSALQTLLQEEKDMKDYLTSYLNNLSHASVVTEPLAEFIKRSVHRYQFRNISQQELKTALNSTANSDLQTLELSQLNKFQSFTKLPIDDWSQKMPITRDRIEYLSGRYQEHAIAAQGANDEQLPAADNKSITNAIEEDIRNIASLSWEKPPLPSLSSAEKDRWVLARQGVLFRQLNERRKIIGLEPAEFIPKYIKEVAEETRLGEKLHVQFGRQFELLLAKMRDVHPTHVITFKDLIESKDPEKDLQWMEIEANRLKRLRTLQTTTENERTIMNRVMSSLSFYKIDATALEELQETPSTHPFKWTSAQEAQITRIENERTWKVQLRAKSELFAEYAMQQGVEVPKNFNELNPQEKAKVLAVEADYRQVLHDFRESHSYQWYNAILESTVFPKKLILSPMQLVGKGWKTQDIQMYYKYIDAFRLTYVASNATGPSLHHSSTLEAIFSEVHTSKAFTLFNLEVNPMLQVELNTWTGNKRVPPLKFPDIKSSNVDSTAFRDQMASTMGLNAMINKEAEALALQNERIVAYNATFQTYIDRQVHLTEADRVTMKIRLKQLTSLPKDHTDLSSFRDVLLSPTALGFTKQLQAEATKHAEALGYEGAEISSKLKDQEAQIMTIKHQQALKRLLKQEQIQETTNKNKTFQAYQPALAKQLYENVKQQAEGSEEKIRAIWSTVGGLVQNWYVTNIGQVAHVMLLHNPLLQGLQQQYDLLTSTGESIEEFIERAREAIALKQASTHPQDWIEAYEMTSALMYLSIHYGVNKPESCLGQALQYEETSIQQVSDGNISHDDWNGLFQLYARPYTTLAVKALKEVLNSIYQATPFYHPESKVASVWKNVEFGDTESIPPIFGNQWVPYKKDGVQILRANPFHSLLQTLLQTHKQAFPKSPSTNLMTLFFQESNLAYDGTLHIRRIMNPNILSCIWLDRFWTVFNQFKSMGKVEHLKFFSASAFVQTATKLTMHYVSPLRLAVFG